MNHQEAARAAEVGIDRSAGHADRVHAGWVKEAAEALRVASAVQPQPFTVEQLRAVCGFLPEPPDLRAWGAATRKATRLGYIVRTSQFAPAASSNNSPKPLYVRGMD